jgi:GLPGLI family protein
MVLWWGDTHSVFESYYGFRIDSVTKIKASNITTPNASNIAEVLGQVNSMKKPAFRYFVHKATTKGVITVYDKLFFDNYKYTQPLAMTSWKIHPESKTILGFKTQKRPSNIAVENLSHGLQKIFPSQMAPMCSTAYLD